MNVFKLFCYLLLILALIWVFQAWYQAIFVGKYLENATVLMAGVVLVGLFY